MYSLIYRLLLSAIPEMSSVCVPLPGLLLLTLPTEIERLPVPPLTVKQMLLYLRRSTFNVLLLAGAETFSSTVPLSFRCTQPLDSSEMFEPDTP